jgi:LPS-assembly lipoprotein
MTFKRAALALLATLSLALSGCGWRPLYADPESGPAAAALRAIHVEPISERIGQRLEWALRTAFNPNGIPTRERYDLRTTLTVSRASLGIQSQGLATRGRLDAVARIVLVDLKGGKKLLANTIHMQSAFDILPNGYATKVAEEDADRRTVEELSREIVARLTLFLQRRAGAERG